MIKKRVMIYTKEVHFEHFIDDSQSLEDCAEKFMEKVNKKKGFLILPNPSNISIVRASEVKALDISLWEDQPKTN